MPLFQEESLEQGTRKKIKNHKTNEYIHSAFISLSFFYKTKQLSIDIVYCIHSRPEL